jgi:hypothetical protein
MSTKEKVREKSLEKEKVRVKEKSHVKKGIVEIDLLEDVERYKV